MFGLVIRLALLSVVAYIIYQWIKKHILNPQSFSADRDERFEMGIKKGTPENILGIKRTASEREIKAAYKAAISRYHPDRVSHLDEEFKTFAKVKFDEATDAYEKLMEQRAHNQAGKNE